MTEQNLNCRAVRRSLPSPTRAIQRTIGGWAIIAALVASFVVGGSSVAHAQLTTLRLEDYAMAPITGNPNSTGSNIAQLARINFLGEEPGGSGDRLFVNDLNGPLYILDKQSRDFTTYLNFNGSVNNGLFDEMTYLSGFANGLVTFEFDPDYQNNGIFYTIHLETDDDNNATSGRIPDNTNFPGLDTTGYMTTGRITNGGSEAGNARQAVMIEWTDTDITNTTFEGTGREIIRVQHRSQIHPMGDMLFNPLAGPGDPDWRVMYVAVGDGGSGETTGSARDNPQRLDQVQGKILRIIPDLNEHTETSSVSDNGRYRIPNDNPFVDVDGARDELYTVGHRNHHRLTWDVNPENPEDNQLIVNEIGLHTWEEVNFIHAGANYGYSEREGNEVLISNSETGPLPNPDLIPWQVNGSTTNGTVTPTYPVIQYGHDPSQSNVYGDAIADGFVYRGSEIPELYGMYLFGDISTGQLFYANYAEMQAADDGDPSTMAEIHTLDLLWDNPDDNPDQGEELYTDITPGGALLGAAFQIVELKYHERGGSNDNLPGGAAATGINGRADIRLLVDGDGEPYLFSKSDGMIRRFIPFEILIANPGDYNDDGVVNAADYVVWRNNQGTENPLANDAIGGEIGNEHYTQWFENFGNVLEGDNSLSTVPEPSALCLIFFALATSAMLRNQR